MKRIQLPLAIILLSLLLWGYLHHLQKKKNQLTIKQQPNDWFFQQRAFPFADINYEIYNQAIRQAVQLKMANKATKDAGAWQFAGPVNVGGRVTAVALHLGDVETFYIGAASGGIFKTQDGGDSWQALFDDQPSLSMGDIALAPSNPDVIYAGTGEANAGGGSVSYEGLGVFRSEDGGDTWSDLGLEESGSIGRLAVHPQNPDICYVAAMGRMFSENSQRGVFRTTDGGQSWEQVLYLNDSTGAIDICLNPDNPEIVYAAMWERVRRPDRRSYGGPSCGIYRSVNGGDTWEELSDGLPTGSNVGRIGISLAPSNPGVLYAIYADKTGNFDGVFKTANGGDTWEQTNDNALGSVFYTYGWWFGRIRVDPVDSDIVYAIGFDLYKSEDGGNSWNPCAWVHVDQHDLNAHPSNHDFVVLGNDGGVYVSQDGGDWFMHLENLPITQFYTCEVDAQNPERIYGGTQDNGTLRTISGNLDDWYAINGGDGFYVLVNPENNQYVYAESQYGGLVRSTNGGSSFGYATSGINSSDRFNWMSPLVFDPNDPSILYFAGNRVYKSINHAQNWTAISEDLSNGAGQYNQTFGTVSTLSVSPFSGDVIYAGTDDGNVWLTQSGGESWNKISDQLPERWVSRVAADPYNASSAFVTFSGYRQDDYLSHIFKTTDFGQSWQDISGDLPEVPINDVIVDPTLEGVLYVATDVGVFVSWNEGENWGMLGSELPVIPVCDLTLHVDLNMLVAATYGRSMYEIYLDELVRVDHSLVKETVLEVFPNPAKEKISVQFVSGDGNLTYEILDMSGRKVLSGEVTAQAGLIEIQIGDLLPASYLLIIHNGANRQEAKFIKN